MAYQDTSEGPKATDPDHGIVIKEGVSALDDIEHIENSNDLVYDLDDEEPELHARTYLAITAMFVLSLVQLTALQGPPAVLTYIGASLNGTSRQTWIVNAVVLGQAVLGPVFSSASDIFQARKLILVASCTMAFIGSAIAPGSQSIYRLIAASALIGVGFAATPLTYCIPSEILPRRWRPMAQASMNFASCLGALIGPLMIGALIENDLENGWRKYYWIMMGLWGLSAIGILFGYKPPNRHTRLDHLSVLSKLRQLDLTGSALLMAGLTLFLVGLSLGSGLYPWTNVRTLTTLIIGIVFLVLFGLYEWKGTSTGILHHDLFRGPQAKGKTFAICLYLIFVEGVLVFAFLIFFPILTSALFEHDPIRLVARELPFWGFAGISTPFWGLISTKFRTIRVPMLTGFIIFTAGMVGLATIQPDNSANSLVFASLTGLGFGAPLILVVAGVQLSTPHHLIATATAVTTSTRAMSATMFTAIYTAAFTARLTKDLPNYVAKAATGAGLPAKSLAAFAGALAADNLTALAKVPGVTPSIIAAGAVALKQAYADSLRVVYIIAAPLGATACIACLFLGSVQKTMNYRVDAPVEALHAKRGHSSGEPKS